MNGIIFKGIAGFYYVRTEAGVFECKARGIFKKTKDILYVGDNVTLEEVDLTEMKAVISSYEPRKNQFIRPPAANIDQLVIVMAMASPDPNIRVLDRLLVMAERSGIDSVICFNKTDLAADGDVEKLRNIYEPIYPILFINAEAGEEGLGDLPEFLAGKRSALSGPSGVGKSTITNALHSKAVMETGEISSKSKRGKHTTRHVEIFELENGGLIYDTPGFTSFEVLEAEEDELCFLYPEFEQHIGRCRYKGCRHLSEPDCAVKDAVRQGLISKSRYTSYKQQMEEIRERERTKY